MPSKFRLRFIFKPLVNLLAKFLIKLKVTPNLATVIMLIFAIFSLISLIIFQNLLLFAIFLFITGIMDGCDGAIARMTNNTTTFGGFFDSVMDRISEFIIFLALLIFIWEQILWNFIDMKLIIFITFLGSQMISYVRARAENFFHGENNKGDFDIGLMARSERLFYLCISSIIGFFLGAYFIELIFLFMWLIIGTALFRFLKINKQIKELET